MRREPAWRVFANEYNSSSAVIRGSGERSPSYVITPLGAKVNRLFVVGVLTDVESLAGENELIRAHVSDPTGVYTLYSGQFQPEVTATLLNVDTPSFIAFVGKVRIFEPEEGVLYLSVRPESVYEVNSSARDRWILETCRNTWERINAMREALSLSKASVYDLTKLGYSRDLAEGVTKAVEFYKNIDLNKYLDILEEALSYLIPEEKEVPKEVEEKDEREMDEIENTVLEVIKEIEGDKGAQWDNIIEKCSQMGIDRDVVEEAISSLLDKGLIYEPVLGTIKTT
ncbi:MAG TPA: hypothetical protein ENF40_00485 [Thermoplasmatales archaeon]|nr:hypothetical protein [Thermoplasmatales archaeon]